MLAIFENIETYNENLFYGDCDQASFAGLEMLSLRSRSVMLADS